ncbi:GNAT family N-acetyltransferase [Euzebya tangerina]|uniref:GNAT family N-acetyltransferase n=1 Tax=Euzebya tangerina TaxID=591198 RepID=UPI000E3206F9|nr:GNAT family N-acetyltransferase [Euzebya tangerina]
MDEVRELQPDEFDLAAPVLFDLRPQLGSEDALRAVLRAQSADGYRLVVALADGTAYTVAGFRMGTNLAWGRYCYVDDFNTLPSVRGRGGGTAVLSHVIQLARDRGCDALHLDSGAGPARHDAHALYHRVGLRITSHHFGLVLS